jgi:hypothetical protein
VMDLAEIEDRLVTDAHRPVARRDLVWTLRQVRALLAAVNDRVDKARLALQVHDDRLDTLEAAAAKMLNLTVVPSVAGLPASASARQWFRVAGDPAVYVGNGAGQPLTKLVPVAI